MSKPHPSYLVWIAICLLTLASEKSLGKARASVSTYGNAAARSHSKSSKKVFSGRGWDKAIRALISNSPAVAHGHIGFDFIDITSGKVLAAQDAALFFTPASNTKLYTTAFALVRLGADYRFRTQLRTTSPWTPGQQTIGDLQLIGGGDPNLSGRTLPYEPDSLEGDPLAAIKQLADQLVNAGIREIAGDVVGVDTRYGREPYPDGWTLDDSLYTYGAPVTALSVGDSTVSVIVRPTPAGQLADLQMRPSLSHFIFLNRVQTTQSGAAHVEVTREPGSNEVSLTGTIGEKVTPWHEDLGVDDPGLFAAEALATALREQGIVIHGSTRAQYAAGLSEAGGTLLAEHVSPPLAQALQVVNKVSQNLHAEMLLREVAKVQTGVGSLANGIAERERFLHEAGMDSNETGWALGDGSGLARQNLATPGSTVALLRYMWMRPERDAWLRTFPIGARDGSLQHRFGGVLGAERILGKTGTLSHVNALSGYIETGHGPLAFSIMVNGTPERGSEVREFIDRLCALFLSF